MRKIYQSATDVPQAIANRAIDIIERHFTASGVRRAEDLPEENKIHLMRDLQNFFQSEMPAGYVRGENGAYVWDTRRGGILGIVIRWLSQVFRSES